MHNFNELKEDINKSFYDVLVQPNLSLESQIHNISEWNESGINPLLDAQLQNDQPHQYKIPLNVNKD